MPGHLQAGGMFGQQASPYAAPQVNGPAGGGVYATPGGVVQQPQTALPGMYPQSQPVPPPQPAPPPTQPVPPPSQPKSEEEVEARQALMLSEAKQGQTEVKLEMTKVASKLEEISSKVGVTVGGDELWQKVGTRCGIGWVQGCVTRWGRGVALGEFRAVAQGGDGV